MLCNIKAKKLPKMLGGKTVVSPCCFHSIFLLSSYLLRICSVSAPYQVRTCSMPIDYGDITYLVRFRYRMTMFGYEQKAISFFLFAPISLTVGITCINNRMGSWTGFPICFTLQAYFHPIAECDTLVVCVIAPCCTFP